MKERAYTFIYSTIEIISDFDADVAEWPDAAASRKHENSMQRMGTVNYARHIWNKDKRLCDTTCCDVKKKKAFLWSLLCPDGYRKMAGATAKEPGP